MSHDPTGFMDANDLSNQNLETLITLITDAKNPANKPEVINVEKAAEMCDACTNTIRDWEKKGKMPRRIGNCRLVKFLYIEIKMWIIYKMPLLNKWELIWERLLNNPKRLLAQ